LWISEAINTSRVSQKAISSIREASCNNERKRKEEGAEMYNKKSVDEAIATI
jgi:hypothetical protein